MITLLALLCGVISLFISDRCRVFGVPKRATQSPTVAQPSGGAVSWPRSRQKAHKHTAAIPVRTSHMGTARTTSSFARCSSRETATRVLQPRTCTHLGDLDRGLGGFACLGSMTPFVPAERLRRSGIRGRFRRHYHNHTDYRGLDTTAPPAREKARARSAEETETSRLGKTWANQNAGSETVLFRRSVSSCWGVRTHKETLSTADRRSSPTRRRIIAFGGRA